MYENTISIISYKEKIKMDEEKVLMYGAIVSMYKDFIVNDELLLKRFKESLKCNSEMDIEEINDCFSFLNKICYNYNILDMMEK